MWLVNVLLHKSCIGTIQLLSFDFYVTNASKKNETDVIVVIYLYIFTENPIMSQSNLVLSTLFNVFVVWEQYIHSKQKARRN